MHPIEVAVKSDRTRWWVLTRLLMQVESPTMTPVMPNIPGQQSDVAPELTCSEPIAWLPREMLIAVSNA